MTMLAVVLTLLALVDWLVALILAHAALRYAWPSLQDRAAVALVVAFTATLGAFLALTRTGLFSLPPGIGIALLALGMIVISLPSVVWLVMYIRGSFRAEG